MTRSLEIRYPGCLLGLAVEGVNGLGSVQLGEGLAAKRLIGQRRLRGDV
jgi:hypothetical protein